MTTEILELKDTDGLVGLNRAAELILRGELVVFPTETVYGLGADATNSDAVEKIYEAKGRPSDNPLIIHLASPEMAEPYAYTTELYYKLAKRFMPGPLTIVLKSKDTIPKITRGGLDTVALRCPESAVARELIRLSGVPIAAPSANISGTPSPTKAEHVIKDMQGRVSMIISGQDSDIGLESTIIKLEADGGAILLRPGKITPEELSSVLKYIKIAPAVTEELGAGETVLSPGMKYKHYAPKAPLYLFEGDTKRFKEYISSRGELRIALIVYSEMMSIFSDIQNVTLYSFSTHDDVTAQAHMLFDLLRHMDEENYDEIYAPLPPMDGVGLALYNRMIRAAAHQIIRM